MHIILKCKRNASANTVYYSHDGTTASYVVSDSIYNELKKITSNSAKIALSCKISSQDTMTDSKVRSDGRIVFYALEIV